MPVHRYEFKAAVGSSIVTPALMDEITLLLEQELRGATKVRGARVARTAWLELEHPSASIVLIFQIAEIVTSIGVVVDGWVPPDTVMPKPVVHLDLVYASTKNERSR